MKVCIVGCGAVGSLFAANLACLDDVDVWAFDLNVAHVAVINERGLRLSGAGEVLGRLRATADPSELPPCDFGIVATKAMHAEGAVAATAHAFAAGCVASVMNGVGNEETLARHVERVIRGTTFPAGKLVEPGHVRWDVKGGTTFGKGSVQTIMPLGNNTAIKLTTARYYTPSGRSIQAKGITPDLIVEEPGAVQQARLREADLQRHLANGQEKDAADKPVAPRAKPAAGPAAPAEPQKPLELGSKDDFQLQQALAHLKGEPVKGQPPTVAQTKPAAKPN